MVIVIDKTQIKIKMKTKIDKIDNNKKLKSSKRVTSWGVYIYLPLFFN